MGSKVTYTCDRCSCEILSISNVMHVTLKVTDHVENKTKFVAQQLWCWECAKGVGVASKVPVVFRTLANLLSVGRATPKQS